MATPKEQGRQAISTEVCSSDHMRLTLLTCDLPQRWMLFFCLFFGYFFSLTHGGSRHMRGKQWQGPHDDVTCATGEADHGWHALHAPVEQRFAAKKTKKKDALSVCVVPRRGLLASSTRTLGTGRTTSVAPARKGPFQYRSTPHWCFFFHPLVCPGKAGHGRREGELGMSRSEVGNWAVCGRRRKGREGGGGGRKSA
eukprot:2101669-Prymnesium_polylepis.1